MVIPPGVWTAGDPASRRHLPALLGAAAARLRAPLAVLGLVLAALRGASVARLGTGAADGGGEGRSPGHVAGADPAQLGAVAAGADSLGHLDVSDAGVAAVLALLRAGDACLDAALVLLVGHGVLLPGRRIESVTPSARPGSRPAARRRSRRAAGGPRSSRSRR